MADTDPTTAVEYREIEEFPGYRVGSDGSIWSRRANGKRGAGRGRGSGAVMRDEWRQLRLTGGGLYPTITLSLGVKGAKVSRKVHVLVLSAFSGPRPSGTEACHRDGNTKNNAARNLYWGTKADNEADKKRHGTHVRGQRAHNAKLNADQVEEIRRRRASGERLRTIAEAFGISVGHVHHVASGRAWGHVA